MLSPYNYEYQEETKSYHFTTKNNIEYLIAFPVDHTFSAVSNLEIENVYQLVISKNTNCVEPLDMQVSATIINILAAFFESSQNCMIYICDDDDGKAEKRHNAFHRWYQNSTLTDQITKVDNTILAESVAGDKAMYTSLLYHNNNANSEVIVEIYQTIQDIINEK